MVTLDAITHELLPIGPGAFPTLARVILPSANKLKVPVPKLTPYLTSPVMLPFQLLVALTVPEPVLLNVPDREISPKVALYVDNSTMPELIVNRLFTVRLEIAYF